MKKIMFFVIAVCLFVCGCDRHPMKSVSKLAEEGVLPAVSPTFIVYDDALKTGGNFFLIPGGGNQAIDFSCTDRPLSGHACIYYSWNGGDVYDANLNINRHDFAGLDIAVSHDNTDFNSTPAVDVAIGAYTKLTFWIRGSLSAGTTVKIEGVDDGTTGDAKVLRYITSLSADWEKKEVVIPADAPLGSVKEFFKLTFIYNQPQGTTTPGAGGAVYIDDIKLEQ